MPKLIYMTICSLDGYIEDSAGKFDWAAPDEEVHAFINDLEREIGTYLYGRRLYETMLGWETDPSLADESAVMADYAQIWQAAEKVVFSTTLDSAPTARTRIKRRFDADEIRAMKATHERDLSIGGPNLARHAFEAGLVDECSLVLAPVIVGAGKSALPADVNLSLDLVEERGFQNGMVYLRYGNVRSGAT